MYPSQSVACTQSGSFISHLTKTVARWVSSTDWSSGKLTLEKKRKAPHWVRTLHQVPLRLHGLDLVTMAEGEKGKAGPCFPPAASSRILYLEHENSPSGEDCGVRCRDSWHLPLCAQVKAVDHKASRAECHHALTCHTGSRLWQTVADCWEEPVWGWQALIKSAAGNGYNKA